MPKTRYARPNLSFSPSLMVINDIVLRNVYDMKRVELRKRARTNTENVFRRREAELSISQRT